MLAGECKHNGDGVQWAAPSFIAGLVFKYSMCQSNVFYQSSYCHHWTVFVPLFLLIHVVDVRSNLYCLP